MRNGMPLVQSRGLTAAVESVEVLGKGPASLLYGIHGPPAASSTRSATVRSCTSTDRSRCWCSTYGSKNGADATFDITGPIGKDGSSPTASSVYGVNEDYWRNFGRPSRKR